MADATKLTNVPLQTELDELVIVIPAVTTGFTVTPITLEEAVLPPVQGSPEVTTQATRSLLTGIYVKTELFGPVLTPLTFHWYTGVLPPFVDMVDNATGVPEQTVVDVAVIEILTGSGGFTVMATVLDVAGFPVGQIALEMSSQVIALLLTGVYA